MYLTYRRGRLPISASLQCAGEATTSQPPDGLLWPRSSTSVVRTVSIPPSHRRNVRSPMLVATASIRESLSSVPSSGALGPGYYSGKAIEWLGQKCLNGIERAIIFKRCWQHQYRLKQWSSSKGDVAGRKRDKQFFAMLGDFLELSRSALREKHWHCLIVAIGRDCYSDRVREQVLKIAKRATNLATNAPNGKESVTWDLNCTICIAPL